MNLLGLVKKAEFLLKDNSPIVLTAIGVTGTVTTAVLAAKAANEAAYILNADDQKFWLAPVERSNKEKAKMVWKLYIPSATSGILTVVSIVAANRFGARKTAAIASAFSLSERALVEYKEKVIETIGEKKEKAVREAIVQDRIEANPPGVVVLGTGPVLCCELYTNRYFKCDIETLRRAENVINAKLNSQDRASLNDFYYEIDLPFTSNSGNVGWTSEKQLKLEFTPVLTREGVPCVGFDYNYVVV